MTTQAPILGEITRTFRLQDFRISDDSHFDNVAGPAQGYLWWITMVHSYVFSNTGLLTHFNFFLQLRAKYQAVFLTLLPSEFCWSDDYSNNPPSPPPAGRRSLSVFPDLSQPILWYPGEVLRSAQAFNPGIGPPTFAGTFLQFTETKTN